MSRKPRGCRYIMDSGVDIVVLGVAIGVLVYNRILAVDIAVLRRQ